MIKRTIRNQNPTQETIFKTPTNNEEHKQIISFLSEELRKYPGLPKPPASINTPPIFGQLYGYWSDNSLIHAVFTTPPYREASDFITYASSEIDTIQWLQTKVIIINSILTSPHHRRQGIAFNALENLHAQAIENKQRYLIAALTSQPVINLFAKAGYTIEPPGTHLIISKNHIPKGTLIGTPNTRYAILELNTRDTHTIRA